ncbi:MAG: serine hydrolase domain-containing protein [Bdellovibrionales bacterium]
MPKTTKSSILKKSIRENVYNNLKKNSEFSMTVGALYKGKAVFNESYGKTYKYYDLASMTKAIFFGTYFYNNPELLNTKVSAVLPWLYMSNIKVKDLLNHNSGLDRYKELYKVLKKLPLDERSWELKRVLRDEVKGVKKGKKHEIAYSDLGFLVLGLFVEELEGQPLDEIFETQNKIEGFHYNILNKPKYKKSLYAPTEVCGWRKRALQGEVFDDNTHVMGGIAPQAGLFGSLENMFEYGKSLREQYKKNPSYFKKVNKEWANGFMVPSGSATTAGALFSKESIGHLGYTGTSFWFDPVKDLFVVILSNRTFPNRADNSFNKYRPIIQNLVYKEFVK